MKDVIKAILSEQDYTQVPVPKKIVRGHAVTGMKIKIWANQGLTPYIITKSEFWEVTLRPIRIPSDIVYKLREKPIYLLTVEEAEKANAYFSKLNEIVQLKKKTIDTLTNELPYAIMNDKILKLNKPDEQGKN